MNKDQARKYILETGLYPSRYWAKKFTVGDKAIVKVCGGYKAMEWSEYNTWRKQK